jgi:ornithine cyclodeaminase
VLYLSLADTERLDLRMVEVVPAIEEAFRQVGLGRGIVAPRVRLVHPPLPAESSGQGRPWRRDLRIIPGAVEGLGYGIRIGGSLGQRAGGVMLLLFDWQSMAIQALISDHLVHAIRSTAPNGVLAKYLALEDASVLGLIGSGRLARWAAEAVCAVRPIRVVRLWGPTPAHRAECVDYLQARTEPGVRIDEVASAEEAVRGAQIVVTATTAPEPVLRGEWLDRGCTVITNRPEELDQQTLRRGRIVTTYRDGVLGHIPPYHSLVELLQSGELGPEAFSTELSDIVVGRSPARTSPDEIIVCLNPAFGVLDAATARLVHEKARAAGLGTDLMP